MAFAKISLFSKTVSLLISFWILYGGLTVCTQAEILYELIDLGTLGGAWSEAKSINETGQVIGSAVNSDGSRHAVLFDPTGLGNNIDLGTLGGGSSEANSINNAGQIVGKALNSSGDWRAVLFDPTGIGNNIDLGTLGGSDSCAYSVNNADQIVGQAEDSRGWNHAALFDSTGAGNNFDLGTIAEGWSCAFSINDNRQIVGWTDDNYWDNRAAMFDAKATGNIIDLGTLGDNLSEARSINNSGQIVGWAGMGNGGRIYGQHAVLFGSAYDGNNIDLKTLGQAWSINDIGQIVGWSNGHATLFDPTGEGNNIDLNTLIDPASGWTLRYAYDINNSGWIVGNGWNPEGKVRAFLLIPVNAEYEYGGGTGMPNDPYLIYTAEQMNAIGANSDDWDKHFKLMADIDLSGYTGTDFNIIGYWRDYDDNKSFTGIFDGNGHTISNFTYDCNEQSHIGLFGNVGNADRTSSPQIKDLGLIDPNINAGAERYVGSLVGHLRSGNITGCYVKGGRVSGNRLVGGMVGRIWWGTITDCHSSVNVMGEIEVAGLIGYNYGGTVRECFSNGNVVGNRSVGGLVGYNFPFGEISNCYATGDISGDQYVGGLVGRNQMRENQRGVITNCYSIGRVTGTEFMGGLVGLNWGGTVEFSFWDIETSGQTDSYGGTSLTTAEMQIASTFLHAGWDFVDETENGTEDIWKMWDGYDYPRLIWEPGPNPPLVFVDINDPNFYGQMSRYEVTNAQYCDFLNAALASGDITIGSARNPRWHGYYAIGASGSNPGIDYAGVMYYNGDGSGWSGLDGETNGGAARIFYSEGAFYVDSGFGNHPVTEVSWHGAMAFANYYGYYLPTEEQWQGVADYDGTYLYGCGTSIDNSKANTRGSAHPFGTTAVGSFGQYGYDMSDMAGNVWEWTSTSSGSFRVLRGGCWFFKGDRCTVSFTQTCGPGWTDGSIGFRVCR